MNTVDVLEVLVDADLYLANLEDCDDGIPNDAMRLRIELEAARAAIAKLISAANYALAQHHNPSRFRPEANHWAAVLMNALAHIGETK